MKLEELENQTVHLHDLRYIETAEVYYRNLHPAAVINLVQAATAPTVLEIAIQHATAQKALLFSNHLQVMCSYHEGKIYDR